MRSQETSQLEAAPAFDVVLGLRNDLQRYGVERMLQSAAAVRGLRSHTDSAGAVEAARDAGAGLLVLSADEVDPSTAERLAALGPDGLKVLLLVDDEETVDLDRVTAVRSAGVLAVRGLTADALHDALVRVARGEVPLPAGLARRLLEPARRAPAARPLPRLTPRERQTLDLMVDGLSNKQIGRRLEISEHGAKRLVANILAKLDCPNRTTAVARALREGLYGGERAELPG
ncbi:response regulator transcription factor [Streptomyces sp. NPDC052109]|uniref:response regulator transcription factor n=1 Tax=Streptomyces sp. NPDC052109 TaxID=3155527 RepID=UPI0034275DC8